MSRYSGKNDLCDWFDGKDDDYINNSKFYIFVGGCYHRLDIHNSKDIVPYYPYIVSMGCNDNEDSKSIIHISAESYIDREEKEHLEVILNDTKKEYRKCKKKKIPFNTEEIANLIMFSPGREVYEIIDRVNEDGDKATIEDIHDLYHDLYRKKLYEKMIESGYEENEALRWCFGWKRAFLILKNNQSVDDFFKSLNY